MKVGDIVKLKDDTDRKGIVFKLDNFICEVLLFNDNIKSNNFSNSKVIAVHSFFEVI